MNDGERLNQIWARVLEKLREVVYEFKITQHELHVAGDFLDRLGKAGVSRSLVNVALAMASVDATARTPGGTRPNLQGPYYVPSPIRENGCIFARDPGPDAPRLTLTGLVTDAATGSPIAGAHLDFWQADHEGHYDHGGNHLRGVVISDASGRYALRTVVPLYYSDHDDDPVGELFRAMGRHSRRAAHLHLKVRVAGKERLMTQLFIADTMYLDSDYVEGAVSEDLLLELHLVAATDGSAPAYSAHFDIAVSVADGSIEVK